MKKVIALLLSLLMCAMLFGCGSKPAEPTAAPATAAPASAAPATAAPATEEPVSETPAVMSYAEYLAAAVDDAVTVETYVQAKQSWWDNKATLYTQSETGAYFLYNMPCSEEEYAKLVPGTKLRVSGYKSAWAGEVEIIDASYEILDGSYIAKPEDVTALLGTDALEAKQNFFVSFSGMTVEPSTDPDGNEVAFLYNWDGSGSVGNDLYFNVSVGGSTFTFTVESYLCGADTEVYKAVESLTVGDVVDMDGFLYWYEGVNPHITAVRTVSKAPSVLSYAEYLAADIDDAVTVETYVQAKQSWWDNKATLYTQSEDGAYFIYNMPCSEEEYAKLVSGTKLRVSGYKSAWAGEVEIIDASYEILEGSFIAAPQDVTALLGTDALEAKQNFLVSFSGMTVEPSTDPDGNEVAFLYNWDGSGSVGNDLYFNVSVGGNTFTFTVESYLCGADTEVYKAVEALSVGDVIDMDGFLYWYEGANPHITAVRRAAAVMSYAEYLAADIDDAVTVETYVQAKQSWWDNKATLYTQSETGAYFIYNMPCSEEEYAKLVPGTKLRVSGYKSAWSGEVEIIDASYEILEGSFIAKPEDVTALLGTDALEAKQNFLVSFSGMTVEPSTDPDGNEVAFLYNWDGSGSVGNDLYFKVSVGGSTFTFTVESYLCGADTEVYKTVEALSVGDVVDMEGFLYWYEGANPHITAVTVK